MRHSAVGLMALFAAGPVQAQLAPPNDNGVSFAHVHISVTDLSLHETLWTDLFDGVLVKKAGYSAVRVPGSLIFFTEQEPTATSVNTAIDHFGFRVRDVDDVLDEWRALGYDVDSQWTSAEGLAKAYITVPDGIRLELEEAPGLSTPTEMHHVHIYGPRYQELPEWYGGLFGATPRVRGSIQTTVDVPGANLSFSDSDEPRAPSEGTSIDHIGLEVEDMDAFAVLLQQKGVEVDFGPLYVESLNLWVAFFTDPSGALVEATQGLDKY